MFEPILMDFWHFLSAERSCINVKTEPRKYCCGRRWQIFFRTNYWGGVASILGVRLGWHGKIFWGWHAKIFRGVWQKEIGGSQIFFDILQCCENYLF